MPRGLFTRACRRAAVRPHSSPHAQHKAPACHWNMRVPGTVTCKHTTPQTRTSCTCTDPRLSAAQPTRCTRKSVVRYLYPFPQTCAEERPNPVSKQCNSDITSVQFMKPHCNKSWHVRSDIQDNSTYSQAQKTSLQTLRNLHKHQNWCTQLISRRTHFQSSAYVPTDARVCVLSQFPHTFSHSHNCTAYLQQHTNTYLKVPLHKSTRTSRAYAYHTQSCTERPTHTELH